jgi:peroxiredoxin
MTIKGRRQDAERANSLRFGANGPRAALGPTNLFKGKRRSLSVLTSRALSTPTCSDACTLPGFVTNADAIKKKGVVTN